MESVYSFEANYVGTGKCFDRYVEFTVFDVYGETLCKMTLEYDRQPFLNRDEIDPIDTKEKNCNLNFCTGCLKYEQGSLVLESNSDFCPMKSTFPIDWDEFYEQMMKLM